MKRRDFFKVIGGAALAMVGVKTASMRTAEARVCERNVGTLRAIYPVGAIYISTSSTNPGTLFGFGTWQVFGAGRTLVGVQAGDATFGTVRATGGATTHTLTAAQMPSHTHTQNSHNHSQNAHSHVSRFITGGGSSSTGTPRLARAGTDEAVTSDNTTATNIATTATNQNTGGGGAHNNLQPYITVFMWRRSA